MRDAGALLRPRGGGEKGGAQEAGGEQGWQQEQQAYQGIQDDKGVQDDKEGHDSGRQQQEQFTRSSRPLARNTSEGSNFGTEKIMMRELRRIKLEEEKAEREEQEQALRQQWRRWRGKRN